MKWLRAIRDWETPESRLARSIAAGYRREREQAERKAMLERAEHYRALKMRRIAER